MDDLLREFLTETGENLELVDVELVRFEQEPNNIKILENVFRLVHTIKGTCGFLRLPRLETLTHAAESLMATFRGGRPVTGDAVTLVLATIDRVKALLDELERNQAEPAGNDADLIARLHEMAARMPAQGAEGNNPVGADGRSETFGHEDVRPAGLPRADLARADARAPEGHTHTPLASPSAGIPAPADTATIEEDRPESKIASSSIRVHVNALDHLMTMV